MMRYYNVPPRAPGMHRRHGVPVGRSAFGQEVATPQWGNIAEMADCLARGGSWDPARGCIMPGTVEPGGAPPGPPPGIQVCSPQAPCPQGFTCATAPEPLSWSLPEGMKSICIPAGGAIPGGTTIPGPPPSMPPPTTQPGGPPPGLPPTETKKSILGLPPVAVYIAGGALGLLVLAALMKKRR